jgi:GT2 family glycosyltransferase
MTATLPFTGPTSFRREHGLVSVVIPTCNEGAELRRTVESILRTTRHPRYEVVVVDDGSSDGSCAGLPGLGGPVRTLRTEGIGVARARNAGALDARGEYLVFLDAHCRVSANWLERFVAALQLPGVGLAGPSFTRIGKPVPRGCGMVWMDESLDPAWLEPMDGIGPYDVPLTTGACQAFRAADFYRIGEFDEGMTRWGYEDVEICLRAWLLGYRVLADPAIVVEHHFRESRGYEVSDAGILYNFLRMVTLHFSSGRMDRVVATMPGGALLDEARARLRESDAMALREELHRVRRRDDDWYCERFMPASQALHASSRGVAHGPPVAAL